MGEADPPIMDIFAPSLPNRGRADTGSPSFRREFGAARAQPKPLILRGHALAVRR